VTVAAGLIAQLADVDLQDGEARGTKWTETLVDQGPGEGRSGARSVQDLELTLRFRERVTLAQESQRGRHVLSSEWSLSSLRGTSDSSE
jgi:hypothetical protein